MRSQGIDIDVDVTPSTPTTGNDDEESGPGIEEESEEEDPREVIVNEHPLFEGTGDERLALDVLGLVTF